jgi:hypothetical protein
MGLPDRHVRLSQVLKCVEAANSDLDRRPADSNVTNKINQMKEPFNQILEERLIRLLVPGFLTTSMEDTQRKATDIKAAVRSTTDDVFDQFCTASIQAPVIDDQQAPPKSVQFCTVTVGQQGAPYQPATPRFVPPDEDESLTLFPSIEHVVDEAFGATRGDFADFTFDIPSVTSVLDHHPVVDATVDNNAKGVSSAPSSTVDPQWLVEQVYL